jgi:hypothetical protein
VEVLLALVIISVTCLYILWRRSEIVDEATTVKDFKTAWALSAQKISEIELDKELFKEEGSEGGDEFENHKGFSYTYKIEKEEVKIGDPNDPNIKPRYIYKVKLTVTYPSARSENDYINLVSYFPKPKEEKSKEEKK